MNSGHNKGQTGLAGSKHKFSSIDSNVHLTGHIFICKCVL